MRALRRLLAAGGASTAAPSVMNHYCRHAPDAVADVVSCAVVVWSTHIDVRRCLRSAGSGETDLGCCDLGLVYNEAVLSVRGKGGDLVSTHTAVFFSRTAFARRSSTGTVAGHLFFLRQKCSYS